MSGQNRILCLLLLMCMAGCKSSKTVITVNPDGSGTVIFDVNFDRATDEQRDKFREQLGSEGFSSEFEEERFLPWFPEPHFTVSKYKFDTEKLTVHAEISFTDINRLLVEKNAELLDINGLDFTVEKDKVTFTVKTDSNNGMEAMIRKNNEALPVIREIVIINGQTKESLRFYEEKLPDTPAADWKGSFGIKGHTIERNRIKRNFAGYPVIKLDGKIHDASWSVHKTANFDMSKLKVTVEAALPQDKDTTYIGWSEPVLRRGEYIPEQEIDLTKNCQNMSRNFINNFSPKPKSKHFILPLEFKFPVLPASAITDSVVRIKVLRANGSKEYKLGRIEPETKYEAGGISFTSGKAKKNRLRFSIKGKTGRIKRFIFQTERGSRFTLKQSSSSSIRDGGSIGLRAFIPLDEGEVHVELYEPIDYVWFDVAVGGLDFENPKVIAAKRTERVDFRKAIASELDESIEGLGKEVFASEENMASFFKGLPDEKLLGGVAQVVSSEYMPNKGNEQRRWYQDIVRKELAGRKEYLEGNKKEIAEKLYSLQRYLPANKKWLVQYFPKNLKLVPYIHDKVVTAIEQGNYELAHAGYFSEAITASERKLLTKAFYDSPSLYSSSILQILLDSKNFEPAFAEEVLKDEALSQYIRSNALRAIFERGALTDLSFAKQYIEDPRMRRDALQAIWNLVQSANKVSGVDVMKERLKPLLSMLQDIAEHPNSLQKDAVKILGKLGFEGAASESEDRK